MHTVIHVTHEAVQKIGGIGAVLHGLLTSSTYRAAISRDILLGPLFSTDGPAEDRLHGGQILYSSLDNIYNTAHAADFARIERDFGIHIVYGRKTFHDPLTGITYEPEVLLLDVRHFTPTKINALKFRFYQDYGIESPRYEHIWDYEQYCRIAEPGLEALLVLGACSNNTAPFLLAHEYMGMPTALAARSLYPGQFRTLFYAHEVATVRRIIEEHPAHDTMFYNVLDQAMANGQYLEDVFGSQQDFYKHPLVEAARFCDGILAVGDHVLKELRFLRKEFKDRRIDLAYNGIPARTLTLDEKQRARHKLKTYCHTLLGYTPDYLLTHVTRLVPSKGLWRDIRVLEHLESHLAQENTSAILFVLSTETAARQPQDILRMENDYHWPAAHREGHPDLTAGEAHYYAEVQEWNAKARRCKILFINQFVTDAPSLGARAPAELDFLDFRKGSDAEFGQSIYEPFGIAQIEPLPFGGICVFTTQCGCADFVRRAADPHSLQNTLPVDYVHLPDRLRHLTIPELLTMEKTTRHESTIAAGVAEELFQRLPRTPQDLQTLLAAAARLGAAMNWNIVAQNYFLPALAHMTPEFTLERVFTLP